MGADASEKKAILRVGASGDGRRSREIAPVEPRLAPAEFSPGSQDLDDLRIRFRDDKTFCNGLVFLWTIPAARKRRCVER